MKQEEDIIITANWTTFKCYERQEANQVQLDLVVKDNMNKILDPKYDIDIRPKPSEEK